MKIFSQLSKLQHKATLLCTPPKLTIYRQVHATKLYCTDDLSLHVSLKVDEHGREVSVWVVWDTDCGDTLEELCSWELSSQLCQVLVDQSTQGNTGRYCQGKKKKVVS